MFDITFSPVSDHSWIPSSAWRCVDFLEQRNFAQKKADFLDDVPVMSATVLGLEMLLNEPYIDLQMASELVLSDIGATIQILRVIGREYDFAGERPNRMVDCLASLDVDVWFGAISAHTFSCDRKHSALTTVWQHCRVVAQYAKFAAESLDGISPEDAYLVGLLHGAGAIPTALGWSSSGSGARDSSFSSAIEGTLPLFVLDALRSLNDASLSSPWRFILTAAHELAGCRTEFYTSTHHDAGPISINSPRRRCLPTFDDCVLVDRKEPELDACGEADSALMPSQNSAAKGRK